MPLKNISLDSATMTTAVHELKTPLLAIKLTLELLLDPKGEAVTKTQRENLEELARSTEQTLAMVQDILAMARLGTQDQAQSRERVAVPLFLDGVQEGLQSVINQKQLTITRNAETSWPPLVTNVEHLRAIVQNLFSNAVKYTNARGQITFTATVTPGDRIALPVAFTALRRFFGKRSWYIISIADSGVGIPVREQQKIFDRFFRASNVKATDPYGTGLGLFLTKALVERIGGCIWFSSKEKKGTTFSIALPYIS